MEISDVRVRLVNDSNERLRAVCSITLDGEFVVRDVKLVEGTGGLFVAMPSRKLSTPCPKCRTQNHLRAKHCNQCGERLPVARIPSDDNGREKAHRDVAHPITASFRQAIQECVMEAYEAECEAAGINREEREEGPRPREPRDEAPPQKPSGYDSIIAELRGGRSADRPRPTEEADGDRGGRRHRRRPDRRDADAPPAVEPPPARQPADSQPERSAPEPTRPSDPNEFGASIFGSDAEAEPVHRDRQATSGRPAHANQQRDHQADNGSEAKKNDAESEDTQDTPDTPDESTSFGAGIL